ncbi:MAG: metallophosphoesterase family protein [Planctomycetes bacterium]|nr:metallophosphoesterase family protein [Planctomycetota bacterium]
MLIGLLSDTHGHTANLVKMLKHFDRQSVDVVVHCGDIGSSDCLEALVMGKPVYAVAGNVDRGACFEHEAAALGINFSDQAVHVPLDRGGMLAATHGDNAAVLAQLLRDPENVYVCHGHTHRRRDERIGGARVVNPGAMHHSRGGPNGAAILDTEKDLLTFVDLDSLD